MLPTDQSAQPDKVRDRRLGFVPPMLPTLVASPPEGDRWLHEIKHDGYRTELIIEPDRCRAFTRRGHDWSRSTVMFWTMRAGSIANPRS